MSAGAVCLLRTQGCGPLGGRSCSGLARSQDRKLKTPGFRALSQEAVCSLPGRAPSLSSGWLPAHLPSGYGAHWSGAPQVPGPELCGRQGTGHQCPHAPVLKEEGSCRVQAQGGPVGPLGRGPGRGGQGWLFTPNKQRGPRPRIRFAQKPWPDGCLWASGSPSAAPAAREGLPGLRQWAVSGGELGYPITEAP